MKRYINQITKVCYILTGIIALSSCKENVFQTEDLKTGLYFINDSTDYSFGITPLETDSYTLELPVQVMGTASSVDREFQVKVIAEKTNATEGEQYKIASKLIVKADSVRGVLPLNILRKSLGNNFYKLAIGIVETESFVPVNESKSTVLVTFNNKIEQPNWLDWQGKKAWPSSKLGVWNPLVYVKFMELFSEMEKTAPNTYSNIVKLYGGPLLPNFPGGWAWDYDNSLTKYVLIPLYRYFIVDHPELGVKGIPKPSGFIN